MWRVLPSRVESPARKNATKTTRSVFPSAHVRKPAIFEAMEAAGGVSHRQVLSLYYPDAPCMEYLPTFTPKIAQM